MKIEKIVNPRAIFVMVVGFFCTTLSNAQLLPGFTADIKEGCVPLVVKFNDLSTGNVTGWLWDLGNGITSTERNPTTFYFDAGRYSIKLTISNGAETQTIVKKDFVVVHGLPELNFEVSKSAGCFPLSVQFTDLTNPVSGTVQSLQWDFGDGTFSNDAITSHTYKVAGSFTVLLKVTNSVGCSQLISKPGYINVLEGVKADFKYDVPLACNPPAVVTFKDASIGKNITAYQWDFGDGNSSAVQNPLHTYTSQGVYPVSLAITNSSGCKDTVIKSSAVRVGAIAASFNSPDSACQKSNITFTNTTLPVPSSVLWKFGDGTTSTAINPVKAYTNEGVYKVTLTTSYGGCSKEIVRQIKILNLPSAGFTNDNVVSTCNLPISLGFNSIGADIQSYLWNFGDGSSSNTASPSHTYNSPGSFSVSLSVTGNNGCTNKLTKTNLIYFGPPKISKINGLPYAGCAPHTVDLSADILTPEPIASYLWNFGDSSISTLTNPSHTYTSPGVYTVTLQVITINGCKSSLTIPGAVSLSEKPVAGFSASPQNACAFEKIKFLNESAGNATKWIWDFGDGGGSSADNPEYFYKDTGLFAVTLIAFNNACADTLKLSDFMYIRPPVAKFSSQLSCGLPADRQFQDVSVGATEWSWDFGDNTTSNEKNPLHTFPSTGTFIVELKVSNGECSHKMTEKVQVINENPTLEVNSISQCKNTVSRFTVNNIDTAMVSGFYWDFGDGNNMFGSSAAVSYNYTKAGYYLPFVVITDKNGCSDTVSSDLKVTVLGPTANFSVQPNACVQSSVVFNDLSSTLTGFPIESRIWNFGDGISFDDNGITTSHSYEKEGRYDIKLTIVDTLGCRDTIVKKEAIWITKPVAAYTILDTFNCQFNNVSFNNQSTGYQLKYLWNLGDGTINTNENVIHKYLQQADYTIKLLVADAFGCKDSLAKTNAVRVANVKAIMNVSDTASACPPFIINLKNTSKNYTSFLWDFGDGSFSNLDSPSHYYNVPGTYKIKLITGGYGPCSDTAIQNVHLGGPAGKFRYTPNIICSPGEARFTATTLNRASFIWDFGDGTILQTADSIVRHPYINPGKYRPKLLLADSAGCIVPLIGTDSILVSKPFAFIKNIPVRYCDSTRLQFFDSSHVIFDSISKYNWSFGDGIKDSINRHPEHLFTKPGLYPVTLKITTKNGCIATDTLDSQVAVVKSPLISVDGDPSVCQDVPVLFRGIELVKDTSVLVWRWKFGNGETGAGQNPGKSAYKKSGAYMVSATATNSSGCAQTATRPLTVFADPAVFAGKDTILCLGQQISLRPTGAQTYKWNADPSLSCINCNVPLAKPADNAMYIVEGTSQQGCIDIDTLAVKVIHPFAITTSPGDTLCVGESVGLSASGSDLYEWTPASAISNSAINNPVVKPDTTTTYRVITSDSHRCFADTGFVKIVVYPIPKFSITQKDETIGVGSSVKLKTTSSADITNYRWKPYFGLDCHTCAEPVASPKTTTTYTAQAWNQGGCVAEDQVSVTVLCNNANIFIPNTFSPNGDGMNDVFYVRGKGISAIKNMTIFNRWGAVVFQKQNPNINDALAGWNGTFNNAPAAQDVFVYKVDVVCENNEIISLKGNVTLIR